MRTLSPVLRDLSAGAALPHEALAEAFALVMDGAAGPDETKALLTLTIPLMADPAALAAGAQALRDRMGRVCAPPGAVDVCGTGGDGRQTLNISTAAAFVIAGCGVPVAKHGNRAMSSRSGGGDVLEALGVKLTADAGVLERCLEEAGVAFLFAQNHHPAMRHVAAARRELGVRTIFNLLGPLANPAGVRRQLAGVFAPEWAAPMAEAFALLGAERVWVVHGAGLDEIAIDAETDVVALEHGRVQVLRIDPCVDLGARPRAAPPRLTGGDAHENAAALEALLERPGEANGDYEEVVVANAAAGLVVAGRARKLADGQALARESLASGAAAHALRRLVALTSAAP